MDNVLTAFEAKKVITMNPSMPVAECVVVKNGKIINVGPSSIVNDYPNATINREFKHQVLVPGFVEGHCHAMEGAVWKYQYLGYFARKDPNNQLQPGIKSYQELSDVITQRAKSHQGQQPIVGWGFDPIYFDGDRLDRHELDQACQDIPVVVIHANFHLMTVNTAMLELIGMQALQNTEGILIGEDGYPNGELQEMAAMGLVFEQLNESIFDIAQDQKALELFARSANNNGITTITDLFNPLTDVGLASLVEATRGDKFNVRLVPAMSAHSWSIDQGVERFTQLKECQNDKLYFPIVKLMTDGSIQGYTARLLEPGYHDGHPNGLWNSPLEEVEKLLNAYHQIGATVHIHTNGDEAVEEMIAFIEKALINYPTTNHRHTLQHCQMINQAQMKRVKNAGICLNMFINHLYYWGDIHRDYTVGYERAQRLEPVASSLSKGIVTAMHSDAPVTPLGPLFSMWCATNRKTSTGDTLGEHEIVSTYQALEMVTINPAYTLKLDHLVGSIETGKFADFAVLNANPLEIDCGKLREINVLATVLGGEVVHRN